MSSTANKIAQSKTLLFGASRERVIIDSWKFYPFRSENYTFTVLDGEISIVLNNSFLNTKYTKHFNFPYLRAVIMNALTVVCSIMMISSNLLLYLTHKLFCVLSVPIFYVVHSLMSTRDSSHCN